MIAGSKTILAGAIGSGKTHSLRTLVNTGLEVFAIFTEQKSLSVLGPVLDKIHWVHIPPNPVGWQKLKASADAAAKLAPDARARKLESRGEYTSFYRVLEQMTNFVDQHGRSYGPVDSWDEGRVLVIDSLTGLDSMIKLMLVGSRTNMTLPEIGEAQDFTRRFVEQVNDVCRCHFVLTAHVERDTDQILGGVKLLIHTHGSKLGPVLPRTFDNFILAVREGEKFYWSTSDASADVTAIHLPLAARLAPDFTALIEGWKKLGGVMPQETKKGE
jgi:hypothetical protein